MTSDNRVFLLVQFKLTHMSHKFKEEEQNNARRLCLLTPDMTLSLDYHNVILTAEFRSKEKLTVRVLNPIFCINNYIRRLLALLLRATVCKYRLKSTFCGTSSKFEFRSVLAHR